MATNESVAIEEPKSTKPEKKSNRSSLWRKGPEVKNKIRYSYKTIDEVLEESKKPGKRKLEISELSKVKVIDMTGPEQRILSGYHAIAGVQKPVEESELRKDRKYSNFAMPELQHNLNLLADVSREAIVENDHKLRYNEDRVKLLHEQRKGLDKTIKQEKISINNMKKVIDILESVIPTSAGESLTLDKAEQIFSSLKENHYTEFCAYEVPVLVVNVVRPLFNQLLSSWKPLEDPMKLIPEFVKWRSILLIADSDGPVMNSHNRNSNPHKLNPYFKLMWDTWVPCVRNTIDSWDCRKPQPMVDLIKNWIPLTSEWILDNIVRETILKKIQTNVEEWNPMTDTVPIQSWVFPWIPLLGKSFETTVYPVIKKKIGAALEAWHPQDASAIAMLQPWMGVFEPGEMEAFLVKNIVPKLRIILDEYLINPNQQSLDTWHYTMGWADMIQPHTMAALLDHHFFPRWLQTLSMWLNMNPDFDQVSKWFSGWKNIIPEKIREQPLVKGHLRSALEIMSKAVGGNTPAAPPQMQPPQFRNMEEPVEVVRSAEVPTSLKALVQNRCEERGILWMPVPNRYMEAKQVFRCGKLLVYFDRTVLFVSQGGGSFTPMSWQEMLENAA